MSRKAVDHGLPTYRRLLPADKPIQHNPVFQEQYQRVLHILSSTMSDRAISDVITELRHKRSREIDELLFETCLDWLTTPVAKGAVPEWIHKPRTFLQCHLLTAVKVHESPHLKYIYPHEEYHPYEVAHYQRDPHIVTFEEYLGIMAKRLQNYSEEHPEVAMAPIPELNHAYVGSYHTDQHLLSKTRTTTTTATNTPLRSRPVRRSRRPTPSAPPMVLTTPSAPPALMSTPSAPPAVMSTAPLLPTPSLLPKSTNNSGAQPTLRQPANMVHAWKQFWQHQFQRT